MAIITWPTDNEVKIAFDAYALAVGRVAHSWNYLHERLGQLFVTVTGAKREIALAVWYTPVSDLLQRNLLKAAVTANVDHVWVEKPHRKEDIFWLLKEADLLSHRRNAAIHAPASLHVNSVADGGPEMGPAFWNGNPQAKKLFGKRLLDEFRLCERRAETLSEFSQFVDTALNFPEHGWPHRPKMPTLRT